MRPGNHHRVAGLTLAALFVLGQGALFAHQLLVPHQACAEHGGELIHVGSSPAPLFDAAAWLAAPAPAAPHGHDHCLAFTSRRAELGPAIQSSTASVCVDGAAVAARQGRHPAVAREVLLRLAPKSSPPV